jgi:hypothetical protein
MFFQIRNEAPCTDLINSPPLSLQHSDGNFSLDVKAISSMRVEPNGNRLAVIFKGTNLVLLYNIVYSPLVSFNIIGAVHGPAGQEPVALEWSQHLLKKDEHYVLSIVWSGGKVQFVPKYNGY